MFDGSPGRSALRTGTGETLMNRSDETSSTLRKRGVPCSLTASTERPMVPADTFESVV